MTYRKKPGKKQLRFDSFTREKAWEAIPKEEKTHLLEFVQNTEERRYKRAREALDAYVVTRYRRSFKAARDAARDRQARVLVGARLDRETAQRVKEAAEASGKSVYRFVADAIQAELKRVVPKRNTWYNDQGGDTEQMFD